MRRESRGLCELPHQLVAAQPGLAGQVGKAPGHGRVVVHHGAGVGNGRGDVPALVRRAQQARQDLEQAFLDLQRRCRVAGVPCGGSEQRTDLRGKPRIAQVGRVEFEACAGRAGAHLGCQTGHQGGLQVQYAPGAAAVAQRLAVVDLARVDRDGVAGE